MTESAGEPLGDASACHSNRPGGVQLAELARSGRARRFATDPFDRRSVHSVPTSTAGLGRERPGASELIEVPFGVLNALRGVNIRSGDLCAADRGLSRPGSANIGRRAGGVPASLCREEPGNVLIKDAGPAECRLGKWLRRVPPTGRLETRRTGRGCTFGDTLAEPRLRSSGFGQETSDHPGS